MTSLAFVEDQITALGRQLQSVLERVATTENDISTNSADIATNLASINGNTASISAVVADVATNVADIATNASGIATNVTDIATNTGNIATNATNISTNSTNIGINTTDIATNTADIATNDAAITTNAGNIATNTTNISTNTTNIGTNTTGISTNTTNIGTNTTNISTNATNITAVRIKDFAIFSMSSSKSITNNSFQTLDFSGGITTILAGDGSVTANAGLDRFNINTTGTYTVGVRLNWDDHDTGTRMCWITKNSAGQVYDQRGTGEAFTLQDVATTISCTSGQYIQYSVKQDSGGNLNVLSGSTQFWFIRHA